ncbi:protein kinase [Colletotrichum sp. SAR11_240]|nr:protein kinase [Colletotrichum sp. SAR11_240]
MSYNSRPLLMNMETRLRPILISRRGMNKPKSGLESTSVIPADSFRRNALSSGITNLRLERLHAISRSGLDRLRLIAEAKFNHQVNWFPLPEIDRRPDFASARLVWEFTFLFDNSDLVRVPKEANNPKVEDICRGYEYLIHSQQMGLDEHMQIMAEIILHGIQVPDRVKGSKAVLQGIPKLRTPPGILKKQLNSGCGFYAIQGYCLTKILFWVGVMLSPGLAFIVVWLSVVGALDLQNAFVPITFLSGLIAIILGISMILGV